MQPFASRVVHWQRRHGRHDLPWQRGRAPYRVWLSEVMLQQTRVDTVIPYFERFVARFPDVQSLARAPMGEVLRLWSGLGYYARARNLHAAARQIVKRHAGALPDKVEALQALPGIGRSTAGAIAALAFGRRAPMLDANARRVLLRCFGAKSEKALWDLAGELAPVRSITPYTQGLMDLGAMVCTPVDPNCGGCPVAETCQAQRKGGAVLANSPRKPRRTPVRDSTWLLLVHQDRILLERRPASGLWGGLWTFPEAMQLKPAGAAAKLGCRIAGIRRLAAFEHAFTHFRLRVQPIQCVVCAADPEVKFPDRRWFPLARASSAAVPSPVRKLLGAIATG